MVNGLQINVYHEINIFFFLKILVELDRKKVCNFFNLDRFRFDSSNNDNDDEYFVFYERK